MNVSANLNNLDRYISSISYEIKNDWNKNQGQPEETTDVKMGQQLTQFLDSMTMMT